MRIGTFKEYKGYIGSIEFSAEDSCHRGKLLDIKDLVDYSADSIEELYEQYKNAVDDYIEFQKEINKNYMDYHCTLTTLKLNCEVMDIILSNTIKNENGEETPTLKFDSIKSLAEYIKAMNDINIDYINQKLNE